MSVIENYPALRPSLLLDFANSGRVDPRINFARAAAASRWNAAGLQEVVAAGVPRIDHDPATGRCLGLLMEGASTNLALYSESMRPVSGAWLATRATLEVVTGVAPPPGMSGVSKVIPDSSGTPYISCLTATAPANSPASGTVFVKSAGATTIQLDFIANGFSNIRCSINLLTGAYANGSVGQSRVRSMRDGWFEVSIFGSVADADISSLRIGVSDANATAANAFYVTGAQFERSSAPTSYIPTSAAAVTRAAENAYIDVSADWYNPAGGTLFVEAIAPNSIQTFARLASLEKSGGVNVLSIQRVQDAASSTARGYFEGASIVAGATSFLPSIPVKVALAGALGDFALSASGSIFTSSLGAFGAPTQLRLGSSIFNSSHLNGHIQRVAYYPRRLTNAQLQRLTA